MDEMTESYSSEHYANLLFQLSSQLPRLGNQSCDIQCSLQVPQEFEFQHLKKIEARG